MREVAIIGAGQLGTRHLQGVLKSSMNFNVTVVDPAKESLTLAEERASQVEHDHELNYISDITALPKKLDFIIIATNADVRLKVLLELLDHAEADTILLEKVLFQRKEDYLTAKKAIDKHNVRCFVNHPRRMQEIYQELKRAITSYRDEPFTVHAYGANWGLGCNGLHVSDIISYLLGDRIEEYSNNELDQELLDSKRAGFKEFTGKLKGKTVQGHRFTVSCVKTKNGSATPITLGICSPGLRISVFEGAEPAVAISELYSPTKTEVKKAGPMLMQSDLSKTIVEQVLEQENLVLPTYDEAMENHLLFIESLIQHINRVTKEKTELCPIT